MAFAIIVTFVLVAISVLAVAGFIASERL